MNVGFHYYMTKALAVTAGFSNRDAQLISYACQYVDHQTMHQKMLIGLPRSLKCFMIKHGSCFEGQFDRVGYDWFDPICTAHSGIKNIMYNFPDIRKKVLLPFHFVPPFYYDYKNYNDFDFVVEPGSNIFTQLIEEIKEEFNKNYLLEDVRDFNLIRLGILMHSLQDTYAHCGFSARNNIKQNGIKKCSIISNGQLYIIPKYVKAGSFLGYNIGHGMLLTYPDKFETRIAYINGRNSEVEINTPESFLQAANHTFLIFDDIIGENKEFPEDKVKEILSNRDYSKNYFFWQINFEEKFKDVDFDNIYNKSKWQRQAFTRCGMIYSFEGDLKWFYFNLAAYLQRKHIVYHLPSVPKTTRIIEWFEGLKYRLYKLFKENNHEI